ncbi:unnamed protein product [Caenorhabditis auriculariae]|uniref:Uncharacterized protein n=1 Tax=Caenorhabditis auriculariae TaxID=2777116 RepID=A0A8S1HF79_9PELO|nr:unnamed protein product [Caenorhabditis auriculariae]
MSSTGGSYRPYTHNNYRSPQTNLMLPEGTNLSKNLELPKTNDHLLRGPAPSYSMPYKSSFDNKPIKLHYNYSTRKSSRTISRTPSPMPRKQMTTIKEEDSQDKDKELPPALPPRETSLGENLRTTSFSQKSYIAEPQPASLAGKQKQQENVSSFPSAELSASPQLNYSSSSHLSYKPSLHGYSPRPLYNYGSSSNYSSRSMESDFSIEKSDRPIYPVAPEKIQEKAHTVENEAFSLANNQSLSKTNPEMSTNLSTPRRPLTGTTAMVQSKPIEKEEYSKNSELTSSARTFSNQSQLPVYTSSLKGYQSYYNQNYLNSPSILSSRPYSPNIVTHSIERTILPVGLETEARNYHGNSSTIQFCEEKSKHDVPSGESKSSSRLQEEPLKEVPVATPIRNVYTGLNFAYSDRQRKEVERLRAAEELSIRKKEEERKKSEEEDRKKAEEAQRVENEIRRRAEEENRKKIEEENRKKAEVEQLRKAEEKRQNVEKEKIEQELALKKQEMNSQSISQEESKASEAINITKSEKPLITETRPNPVEEPQDLVPIFDTDEADVAAFKRQISEQKKRLREEKKANSKNEVGALVRRQSNDRIPFAPTVEDITPANSHEDENASQKEHQESSASSHENDELEKNSFSTAEEDSEVTEKESQEIEQEENTLSDEEVIEEPEKQDDAEERCISEGKENENKDAETDETAGNSLPVAEQDSQITDENSEETNGSTDEPLENEEDDQNLEHNDDALETINLETTKNMNFKEDLVNCESETDSDKFKAVQSGSKQLFDLDDSEDDTFLLPERNNLESSSPQKNESPESDNSESSQEDLDRTLQVETENLDEEQEDSEVSAAKLLDLKETEAVSHESVENAKSSEETEDIPEKNNSETLLIENSMEEEKEQDDGLTVDVHETDENDSEKGIPTPPTSPVEQLETEELSEKDEHENDENQSSQVSDG